MTSTDYLIDIALVSIVLLQIRPRTMDLKSLLLPVASVAGAAAYYLGGVPTAGHDVTLDVALGAVGATLGILCALTTRVWRGSDGLARSQAGIIAATLWIVGVGSRFAFAEYTTHGGGANVTRFSVAHQITSTEAWTAAIVIMALSEVVARLIVLRLRARTSSTPAAIPASAARTSVAA